MALIIKGDMPKGCYWYDIEGNYEKENLHYCDYLFICHNCTKGSRPDHCPIIGEIPDNHGDLVDAQAIEERAKEIQYERGRTYKEALLLAFDEASVVVEATE